MADQLTSAFRADSDATLYVRQATGGTGGLTNTELRAQAVGTSLNYTAPKTALAPASVSVGTGSTSVLAANPDRQGCIFVNTSAVATVSLAFGSAAVLNKGVTLFPNGGTFTMDINTLSTAAVNAIASVAATNLAVQEYGS